MKNKIFLFLIFAFFLVLSINSVLSADLEFYMKFSKFPVSAELLNVRATDLSLFKESSETGEYNLNVQILDSSKTIIEEKNIGIYFFIFDGAQNLTETSSIIAFNYLPEAKYIRVYYNSALILEKDFFALLCNKNRKCENEENGNENLQENYLSCSDCKINEKDGECISQIREESDGLCDPDCFFDFDCENLCGNRKKDGNELAVDCGMNCNKECSKLCQNGKWDETEEGIDCGRYCDNNCDYSKEGAMREVKKGFFASSSISKIVDFIIRWTFKA